MRGTILPALMVLIGVALIVRTIAASPDGVAIGLILGVLFVAAGAGRLYVERRL
jgi:ascorbate-specific PTS system EIIC-type component UlaA